MAFSPSSLLDRRLAGVLLHISSLPSRFYVGDLGAESRKFVDFLSGLGVQVWQTLPINMPHNDNSPYQSLSAYAGNPDYISLEALVSEGLLSADDLIETFVSKSRLLDIAYQNFCKTEHESREAFAEFCIKEGHWLEDFALFLALRNSFKQLGWEYWPEAYKNRHTETLLTAQLELAEEISVIKFTQFVFYKQWMALKQYANAQGVYLFGDIPIFVAYDSADVWAHPHLFKLDDAKNMSVVAGVPPDYFSETGQRWGNPHYNWEVMQTNDFEWWVSRMVTQNALFDMVRIDHFRGLEAAWEIPAHEKTAANGYWVTAPGCPLLQAIKKALPDVLLIAEDLGIITEEVDALRAKYHLPGMKVLQFAFSGEEDNPYLPQNIPPDSVMYTGTHDNDTTVGWYNSLDDHHRWLVHEYIKKVRGDHHQVTMPQDLIEIALESKAFLAVIPMQDLLALNGDSRMNTPGTTVGNWAWRFEWPQLDPQRQQHFADTIQRTGRKGH
jgi:4-alpha-glucanotransferase